MGCIALVYCRLPFGVWAFDVWLLTFDIRCWCVLIVDWVVVGTLHADTRVQSHTHMHTRT